MMLRPTPSDWLIHQLTDSAFPIGGFAHSAGLEAAWQLGLIDSGSSLAEYLTAQLLQLQQYTLPLVLAAQRDPQRINEFDAACSAMLSNHVARRSSLAQGQAMVLAASRTFASDPIAALHRQIKAQKLEGHFAPVYGACASHLGLDEQGTLNSFSFIFLRGLISAAVRLGIVGPLEGQSLQWTISREAAGLLNEMPSLENAAQTAPMLDLFQGLQDRLYSRLFQS